MLKKDKKKLGKIAVFGLGNIVLIGLQGFPSSNAAFFSFDHGSA